MFIIGTIETVGVIIIAIMLVLLALGITIIHEIKFVFFLLCAAGAIFTGGMLLVAAIASLWGNAKRLAFSEVLISLSLFLMVSFPIDIERVTDYDNGNVYLWWGSAILALIIIFLILSTMAESKLNSGKGKVPTVLAYIFAISVFIFIGVIKLWLIGGQYNYLLDSGRMANPTSYVTEIDGVELYKNKKKFAEDNVLLGVYPKGTVMTVKKPFLLGKLFDGYWIETKKISYGYGTFFSKNFAPEGELYLFEGKYIAPDGKTGYIAIYNTEESKECLTPYERITEAEFYEQHHPKIVMQAAKYLWDNYDFFGYQSYEPETKTVIGTD